MILASSPVLHSPICKRTTTKSKNKQREIQKEKPEALLFGHHDLLHYQSILKAIDLEEDLDSEPICLLISELEISIAGLRVRRSRRQTVTAVVQTRFEVEQAAHYLIIKCQGKIEKRLFLCLNGWSCIIQIM
ncbi:uncharacterized protein LOC112176728 isoform X2 [Rosa chinensis]|uniref:uncharacterized protein LOC112176728 isoform X2 n=1 Tax=Rosa chinensis TaxID=74649 RepID=UPI001AD8D2A0|nr:uncharacterized protein LOC112176728 isoform X2 [Rosa chinensis]